MKTLLPTHPLARKLWTRALAQGKMAHAYLIVGPAGAGKRTLAREFAAAVLCEEKKGTACLECGSCRRVLAGTHPDLVVVTAETRSILIDQMRELSSRLRYHSFEGGYKIGIVVEAETMTVDAQNSFLKTLEEPPPNTLLLLTCVNLSRLLPTIISRCQLLRVGPWPEEAIADLAQKERGLSPESARLVAALAQGNARRALDLEVDSLLRLRREMVQKLLSLSETDRLGILDFAQALAKLEQPPEFLLELLAGFYWDVLDYKLGRVRLRNRDLEPEVKAEAERSELRRVLQKMEMIHTARLRLAGNANARLLWEVLLTSLTARKNLNLLAKG